MPSETRYCDDVCRNTWTVVQLSRLTERQRKVLDNFGVGFHLTDEEVDAVLERLKSVKTGL